MPFLGLQEGWVPGSRFVSIWGLGVQVLRLGVIGLGISL